MKKKLCLLLVFLFLLPVLTGCHGTLVTEVTRSDGSSASVLPAEPDTDTPVTIVFWAKNDTNKTQVAIYKQAIADFQALYPHITVELRLYTDYNKIYNDVVNNISTHTTPNVCISYPDHIATYMTGDNVIVPLTALAEDPVWGLGSENLRFSAPTREEIVPAFLKECVLGEQLVALPFMRSTEAVYINRDLVEKLGHEVPDILTWDFVWEVSEAAMAKADDGTFLLNGQTTLIPCIYKSTDNMMISMIRQKDAGYSTENGEIRLFNDTTRDLLKEIYAHGKSRAFSTFSISSYPGNFLNAGQCIFAIDSTGGATWMGSRAPLMDIPEERVVDFETVVRPIPQFDPEHPRMISQGPSVCLFAKENDQEVLASWLFLQYLLSDDVQIAYSETEGYVPVTLKAQNNPEYLDYLSRRGEDNSEHYSVKIDAVKLLLEHQNDTFTTPVFNGSTSLRQAAGQLIEETVKAARRKIAMDESFLDSTFDKMVNLYRLDQIPAAIQSGDPTESTDPEETDSLPASSRVFLIVLAATWLLIGLFTLLRFLKAKRKTAGRK